MSYLQNDFFLLALTCGVYFLARYLQKKTGWVVLNPILITIVILIGFLKIFDISYESYSQSGDLIGFWMKPAIVALGVPLYLQLETIKKQLLPIILSQLAGCVAGIFSVVLIAHLMGASKEIILSLAPKSVSSPIAMDISSTIGGIPSLTVAVVILVGLFGGVLGFQILRFFKIQSPIAQSLSIGTASHALGTSVAMDIGKKYGAYAGLGLTINGILTAIFAPLILRLMGFI